MVLNGEVHAPGRLTPEEVRGPVEPVLTIWSRKEKPLALVGNEANRTCSPQTSSPYSSPCIDPAILAPVHMNYNHCQKHLSFQQIFCKISCRCAQKCLQAFV